MPQSPLRFLGGLKLLHGALSILLATLSATLIRDRLIPYQLKVIGTVGALFILVGLIITLVFPGLLRRHLKKLVITSLGTLLLLTFLQMYLVVTIENYGEPPDTYHFLVGFKLTDQGRAWVEQLHSEEATISMVGPKRIPVMYGNSFLITKAIYSLTYIAFVLAVVASLGGLQQLGTNETD